MTTKWADALAKAVAETGLQPSDPSPEYKVFPSEPTWNVAFEDGQPTPENLAWFGEQGYTEITHQADDPIALSTAHPSVRAVKGYTAYWWLRQNTDGDVRVSPWSYVRKTGLIDYTVPMGSTLTVWWKKTRKTR